MFNYFYLPHCSLSKLIPNCQTFSNITPTFNLMYPKLKFKIKVIKLDLELTPIHYHIYKNSNNLNLFFTTKSNHFYFYTELLYWCMVNYLHKIKLKWVVLMGFVKLIFLDSTSIIKDFYKLMMFLMPLHKHKKTVYQIMQVYVYIIRFAELFNIQIQTQFLFKGKLGLKGDNKKQKHSFFLTTTKEHKFKPHYSYDGLGRPARFGTTFLRIKYAPFYKIIPY